MNQLSRKYEDAPRWEPEYELILKSERDRIAAGVIHKPRPGYWFEYTVKDEDGRSYQVIQFIEYGEGI